MTALRARGVTKTVSQKDLEDGEIFISDVADDNALMTIQSLCDVRAASLVENRSEWVAGGRLFYRRKFVPFTGQILPLSERDESDARRAFAAGARCIRLSGRPTTATRLMCANVFCAPCFCTGARTPSSMWVGADTGRRMLTTGRCIRKVWAAAISSPMLATHAGGNCAADHASQGHLQSMPRTGGRTYARLGNSRASGVVARAASSAGAVSLREIL
jgi:hypothetical protein